MRGLQYPEVMIEMMISLNHAIRAGHAEEITTTVESVLGRPPIRFARFVDDNRNVWL